MEAPAPLSTASLRKNCDPAHVGFATSRDLPAGPASLGQGRAREAIATALAAAGAGFNVFALGPRGVGKRTLVLRELAARSGGRAGLDWCYVHSFDRPQHPRAMALPAGRGVALRGDMERLLDRLGAALPAAFQAQAYRSRARALDRRRMERRNRAMAELALHAAGRDVAVIETENEIALAPLKEGKLVGPEDFEKLPPEDRARLTAAMEKVNEELRASLEIFAGWDREHVEALDALRAEVANATIGEVLEEIESRYADLPEVRAYLAAVREDVLANVGEFIAQAEEGAHSLAHALAHALQGRSLERYRVNVIVEAGAGAAPVVVEERGGLSDLVGRIEHRTQFGALVTDYTMIRAGALHRANGGFLVLDARAVLTQPFAWDALKRALRTGQVRIESPAEALGLSATEALEPEPIPLDLKVILLGERFVYFLLAELDPEFQDLFKVAADFDDTMPRSAEAERDYARMLGAIARERSLRPVTAGAAARLVEEGSRFAHDAERLSLDLEALGDVLREADGIAAGAGKPEIHGADVAAAVEARHRRLARVPERMADELRRGALLVATAGEVVGQVNGLAAVELGPLSFGHPVRITARVGVGKGEVVDIEREVELGGPIHSKGVLILAGFLGERYAADGPLALRASLVFEQSYAGVEGDSASLAELVALLSALARAPVRQGRALTGSVNQRGEVQAVGAVEEKIEGFFDLCRARGLDGKQGVIVPAANAPRLMLRPDVVDAAARGEFEVWAVRTVDEALALLASEPAERLNERVKARLAAFAHEARRGREH